MAVYKGSANSIHDVVLALTAEVNEPSFYFFLTNQVLIKQISQNGILWHRRIYHILGASDNFYPKNFFKAVPRWIINLDLAQKGSLLFSVVRLFRITLLLKISIFILKPLLMKKRKPTEGVRGGDYGNHSKESYEDNMPMQFSVSAVADGSVESDKLEFIDENDGPTYEEG